MNGEDITSFIRSEEVGNFTSKVISVNRKIREKMVSLQRDLAAASDIVMDGRDIGTCVLPDADVKIYLTADAGSGRKRRLNEIRAKGADGDLAQIEDDIRNRDKQDTEREISPLKQADDAVLLDSSDLTADESSKINY